VPDSKFLLYRTDQGKFILKLEGEEVREEFQSFVDAVACARKLRRFAALTVYDPLGRLILETTV
jgi:hypothetical protein